jgi:hypothetical protein
LRFQACGASVILFKVRVDTSNYFKGDAGSAAFDERYRAHPNSSDATKQRQVAMKRFYLVLGLTALLLATIMGFNVDGTSTKVEAGRRGACKDVQC